MRREPPPHLYFVVSAVFHYLGPAFAVLLFARVDVLGVAWLRIASAAAIFAVWRRPWRAYRRLDGAGRRLLLAWGAVLAVMNCCFYVAIDRLPLGTVAAIEFLPVIALAAAGARSVRNGAALALAVPGVYVLTDVRLEGEPLGVALAFANAILFALYIVLAHRVAQHDGLTGIDGLAASMLIAGVVVTPVAGAAALPALSDPVALAAGIGVGVSSSVIPYIADQLAMARLARATYALMVSLLPATATVIGVIVLAQVPSAREVAGVGLVVAGVALHRDRQNGGDMHVAIAGGHGKIGLRLTRLLSERGDTVLSLIRNPEHEEDVREAGGNPVVCDLEAASEEEVATAVRGADAVVFAAGAGPGSGPGRKETMDYGGAVKLIAAARADTIARYVMVSSMAADPNAEGDGFAVYLRAKGRADADLEASGLDHTIVRPGRLTDDPGTGAVELGGSVERGEIPRDDVAAVLARCLAEPGSIGKTFEVVGGETPVDEALRSL